MTALRPGASPPPLAIPIVRIGFISNTLTEIIDKFNAWHELADVTQDPREEVESKEDSE
jgi:hypothetical protein